MQFKPTLHKLSNGIPVILDPMDIETAAMKICIKGGASIEKPNEYGISHFLEHMVLNGTVKYPTAKILRDVLNDNGGTHGASTSTHDTEYYGRILAENFSVLLDVLSDIVLNPKLSEGDLEKERAIVIQEIKRSQDSEDRKFYGLVKEHLFGGSYLERYDSMGSVQTLESFSRADLLKYKNEKYTAENIIIGISGNFGDSDKILQELESLFGAVKKSAPIPTNPGLIHPSVIYDVRDDRKQTKLFIGFQELYPGERKYDYEMMCVSAFQSALARRLIEEIQDKKGLAYAFGHDGFGDRYLYANGFGTALSPEKLSDMIATIASGGYDITHNTPITQEELNRYNVMARLGRADFLEDSVRRRNRLVIFYANHGELYNPNEFDAMRERLTTTDIMKYSANYFNKPLNIIAQGPACDIDLRAVWENNFK